MNKKLLIAFVIFTAIGLGIFYILTTGQVGLKYDTVPVEKDQAGKYIQDTGIVTSSEIRAYYGNGQKTVEKLDLKLGDPVKKGQLLIEYKNFVDLEIQKINKQIEALEASYKEVLSGADVSSISTARIEVAKSKSDLEEAKKNLERIEKLYESGAVSLVAYENALNEVDRLENNLEISRNTYSKLTKALSQNNKKKYEAEIDVLILSLEILEKSRPDFALYSDIDGIVTEINTFMGDTPRAGHLFLEIMDPSKKVILVEFMVEDARLVEAGMQAEIHDKILNIDVENLQVNRVYPKAFETLSELNVEENRQRVEVGLPGLEDDLSFGTEVQTQVMVEPPRQVLVVPISALIYDDSKEYVDVVVDNVAQRKEVVTGTRFKSKIEILEGLKEGDQVILNYQESE